MVLAKQYLCVPEKITSLNAEPLLLTEEMSHNQKKKKRKTTSFSQLQLQFRWIIVLYSAVCLVLYRIQTAELPDYNNR
jgi:hypothetical protein